MKLPAYNEEIPYGGQNPIQEIIDYANHMLVLLAIACGVYILYGVGGLIDRFRNPRLTDAGSGYISSMFEWAALFAFAGFCVFLILNKAARIAKRQ
jgi:hypothetical protein